MLHRSDSAADAASLERLGLCIAGLKQPSARRVEPTEAVAFHSSGSRCHPSKKDRQLIVGAYRHAPLSRQIKPRFPRKRAEG